MNKANALLTWAQGNLRDEGWLDDSHYLAIDNKASPRRFRDKPAWNSSRWADGLYNGAVPRISRFEACHFEGLDPKDSLVTVEAARLIQGVEREPLDIDWAALEPHWNWVYLNKNNKLVAFECEPSLNWETKENWMRTEGRGRSPKHWNAAEAPCLRRTPTATQRANPLGTIVCRPQAVATQLPPSVNQPKALEAFANFNFDAAFPTDVHWLAVSRQTKRGSPCVVWSYNTDPMLFDGAYWTSSNGERKTTPGPAAHRYETCDFSDLADIESLVSVEELRKYQDQRKIHGKHISTIIVDDLTEPRMLQQYRDDTLQPHQEFVRYNPPTTGAVPMKNTPIFESRNFIRGHDAADLSEDDLIREIKTLEDEREALKAIKTGSKAIEAKISKITDAISKIVEVLDERAS